jgi:hypothetical protein
MENDSTSIRDGDRATTECVENTRNEGLAFNVLCNNDEWTMVWAIASRDGRIMNKRETFHLERRMRVLKFRLKSVRKFGEMKPDNVISKGGS